MIFNHLEQLLESKKPQQSQESNIAKSLHQIADMIHKRSLVIIFSDMFENQENTDAIFTALQHLKHYKHEVILFHVVHKRYEIDFDYQNRPYKFIDSESGEILKLNPKEIKDQYIKRIDDYTRELKLRCGQFKIDFIEADMEKGFDAILLPYLLKRQKMM